jgi:DNA-binding NtrC family response regulator
MGNLKTLVSDYERQLIESALSAARGNQRRAAYALGVLPTTLHEKMKRLGLMRRENASLMSGYAEVAQQEAR